MSLWFPNWVNLGQLFRFIEVVYLTWKIGIFFSILLVVKTEYNSECNIYLRILMAFIKWELYFSWNYLMSVIPQANFLLNQIRSDQISCSVVSNSLRAHESQHARPPCPSPTPGVHATHMHQVGDAIQPSHPLSSPSPLAANPSQHQSLFQWVNSSHEVAKVLEFQL